MIESIVGCKWSMSVLDAIIQGVHRPGALQRECEGISTKVLNERLRKLTRFNILARTAFPEVPPRVEYHLTEFGQAFIPIFTSIRELQAQLNASSLDTN